jgi:SanA protein
MRLIALITGKRRVQRMGLVNTSDKEEFAENNTDSTEKPAEKPEKKLRYAMNMLIFIITISLSLVIGILLINWHVYARSAARIMEASDVPKVEAAIVLGCFVYPDGSPSAMLYDRVLTGVELYKAGKVDKLLMSGDHGEKSYNEVKAMRLLAEKMGVPIRDIFMDHAGFNTYESMYRARDVFRVKSAIIVTQDFHLNRAVYLSKKMGIETYGVKADKRRYLQTEFYHYREIPARVKAFLQAEILKPKPTFLGTPIPITGDGRATHD